ncbi:MAG: SDR family oxidoreductase [Bacteroidota bacterium]
MNLDLTNKYALVGGSSKGIGKATAIALASLGANVTLMARSEDVLKKVMLELDTSKGQEHDFLVIDYSNREDLAEQVTSKLKVHPYHILINNTGGPAGGAIVNATADQFLDAYQKHLVCNHLLVQLLLEGMKAEKYGRIINIISTSVRIPIDGLGVSNTTRGAVASWSRTMANELGQFGITVNNVLPGATSTGRLDEIIDAKANKGNVQREKIIEKMESTIPMQRFAAPSEIGEVAAFLASPSASYVTGISMRVDGGRTKSI